MAVWSTFSAYRCFYEWLIQSFTSRFVFSVGSCNAPARLLRVRVTGKSTPVMHRTMANNGKEESRGAGSVENLEFSNSALLISVPGDAL